MPKHPRKNPMPEMDLASLKIPRERFLCHFTLFYLFPKKFQYNSSKNEAPLDAFDAPTLLFSQYAEAIYEQD